MVWEVESAGVSSYLLGTAHFFPYSFRASLNRLIRDAHVVVLEGPLDEYSMAKVEHAGVASEGTPHLFDNMDTRTIAAITDAVTPYHRDKSTTILFNVMNPWLENPAYTMVKGMKPWRAFFSLYWGFLQSQGWKYSVDLEAYSVAQEMKKKIVFLESIEEQIEVLESLSMDQMIDFLKRADRWRSYTKEFVTWYLKGDPRRSSPIVCGFLHGIHGSSNIVTRFSSTECFHISKPGTASCAWAFLILWVSTSYSC